MRHACTIFICVRVILKNINKKLGFDFFEYGEIMIDSEPKAYRLNPYTVVLPPLVGLIFLFVSVTVKAQIALILGIIGN